MSKWIVQQLEEDEYDVFKDRRIVQYAVPLDVAEDLVRRDGERSYTLEEMDGYQSQVNL